jgi:N-acetylneuraminic acid mutarotase
MEKKSISRSAFLSLRALIALLLCASACFIAVGTVPAFLRPEERAKVSQRTVTFAERVSYQRAIEEVYWRHRIWPKDNPGPKPTLDAVMSRAQVERKVNDYLRMSQLLAEQWQRPITPEQLQAEVERMASHTRRPDVLRELFAALGNDPFVIAECLARPILAERLSDSLAVVAAVSPASRDLLAADTAASTGNRLAATANVEGAQNTLPEISGPLDCADGSWTATMTVNAPNARDRHTAVWTGSEMIVWGGSFLDNGWHYFNTGGRYNPATDSWTATSTANAPVARDVHTAVWTGSEMIVWGGGDNNELNTGGRYNPATDSWTATSTANAPTARVSHTAVWTGSEMIVWGGYGCGGNCILNSGGRYNPISNSWTGTSTSSAPSARWYHGTIWTGSEMIVWGGTNSMNYLNTGGRYDPKTDRWTATGVPNGVLGRAGHTAVWTGGEMIVWGGADSTFNDCNTGGRYNPSTDSWMATSLGNAPSARDSHTAIWTGTEMIA